MESYSNKINAELAKIGIIVDNIYDLVNTNKPYREAIPVLINLLKECKEPSSIKEGIVRALAVKEAAGKANSTLLDEYDKTPKDRASFRWAIGNTISVIITHDDVSRILPIIQNKENGISRQMFVLALGKAKEKKSEFEDILIKLLDDDEVASHALDALGKIKSQKAKEKISTLINHPRSLIRKEAQKALKKIL